MESRQNPLCEVDIKDKGSCGQLHGGLRRAPACILLHGVATEILHTGFSLPSLVYHNPFHFFKTFGHVIQHFASNIWPTIQFHVTYNSTHFKTATENGCPL